MKGISQYLMYSLYLFLVYIKLFYVYTITEKIHSLSKNKKYYILLYLCSLLFQKSHFMFGLFLVEHVHTHSNLECLKAVTKLWARNHKKQAHCAKETGVLSEESKLCYFL